MNRSIFSTYKTGENRVTSSILAVLKSLSLDRMERLLRALLEEEGFQLIRFQNQPSKGGSGTPDAIIRSSANILIETKLKPNSLREQQLRRHLERLDSGTEDTKALLAITPDSKCPPVVEKIEDTRFIWTSFAALSQAIEDILSDEREVVSEREAFLLRELQAMLEEEGLLPSPDDCLVVAARVAWPFYEKFHAYVCQAGRGFRHVKYMAFYSDGQIQPFVPSIVEKIDNVPFQREHHKEKKLKDLIEQTLKAGMRKEGISYQVFFLTPPDSPETIKLETPVINDSRDVQGKPTAFTQGQRYVKLSLLRRAKKTSDLN